MNTRTAMISITGFLILILIAVAMSAVGTGGKTAARRIAHEQATDTIEYLRAYDYRTLSIGFDSMAVTCQLDMKESTAILEAFMSKQPSGGRPSHTVTMTVFPNPVSSKGRYSLILETSRRFEVSLFSLDGGLIRRFFEGEKPGGVHVLPLDATGIASGAYMLVCRDGAGKTLASKTVHIQR